MRRWITAPERQSTAVRTRRRMYAEPERRGARVTAACLQGVARPLLSPSTASNDFNGIPGHNEGCDDSQR